ncbi:RagB/SusD family nutrient uptake outer membrane protein [Flavobacterium franklandianum]|uniref:RagB/SusD family nutrient uptake outer membrane protein n=1 Tax=Flavobacterium franklandianum TaxID=2594430 RepID=UPI00117A85FD|nr:RagB/SusD family nutrient uptake outer membrane protein [Flavobacterium franklandianum]TRX28902.1 RagB/SusD family nutrient uptake outer membrane protein [Flavobacterium franklandianum]
MKKIIVIIAVFTSLLFSSSCESELELNNPNDITVDQYWKTESDAQAGVNSIYAMFYKDGLWARWIYFRLDLTSDEGYSSSPWTELADWTRFNYINYNFWEGQVVTWRDTYKAIFRCNQVLANVPNITFQNEDDKKKILAQAKFFRALHYYYAAVLWENIPLVLTPSTPTDLPEQKNVTEIWAQIEKDLNESFVDLPTSWSGDQTGRPDKSAAKAFLAKVYMQQRKWAEAKGALEYIITGAGAKYNLVANYRDNFTDIRENNSESVFEIQFGDQRKGGTGEDQNAAVSSNRAQFFAPRSIGWSDGQARFWLVNAFKQEKNKDGNLDIRLRYTLYYPQLQADFGDKTYNKTWEWGAEEAWFRKGSRDYYRDNEDYYSQVNYRLIRYADVLLRYAEVLNETGNTAGAYQYVDMVRARVNLNTLAVAHPEIGNDKVKFLERLKMERALELAGESVRWEDLKRWGDLDTQASVDKIKLRDPDFNNFVVGKNHRLPIPQVEDDNNPNLTQHPEY